MSSKCEMHQSKYSDFIDVVFDVPRFHVSDSLSSELNQTRGKDGKRIRKNINIIFITMLHCIVKLLKKSTLFLKTPRT